MAILPGSLRVPDEDLPEVMRLPAASVEAAASLELTVGVVTWVEVIITV